MFIGNVVLDGVRKIPDTHYIEKSYNLLQHNKFIALEVLQECVNSYISKERFLKTYYPILLSCEWKSMFSFWVANKKSIAVKYVKKCESFEETSLTSVEENFMVCNVLGDISYFRYTWIRKSIVKFRICDLLKSIYRTY